MSGEYPSFPLYYKDFEQDENVKLMNLEQVGAYFWLLMSCWHQGSLPAETEKLQKLAKYPGQKFEARIWNAVAICFTEKNGRLYHARCDEEKRKIRDRKKKLSISGKDGALRRWGGHSKANRVAIDSPIAKACVPVPSPVPLPSNKDINIPPNLEETRQFFLDQGFDPVNGNEFWDHHNAGGWIMKNNRKMKDWQSAARTWIRNGKRFGSLKVLPLQKKDPLKELEELEKNAAPPPPEFREALAKMTGGNNGR